MTEPAALTLLTAVTQTIAQIDGPISPRVASGALMAMSGILQERRAPLSLRTLEAVMGLVVALREELAT